VAGGVQLPFVSAAEPPVSPQLGVVGGVVEHDCPGGAVAQGYP
jgi:hypothetical protein